MAHTGCSICVPRLPHKQKNTNARLRCYRSSSDRWATRTSCFHPSICACRFNLIATTHTETTGSVAVQSDEPIRAQNALPETVWRTEGGAWLVKGKCSQRLAVNASLFHGVSATGGHSLTHTQRNLIRNDRPQDSSVAKVQDKDRPYLRQATALPTQHVRLILSASAPACRVLPPRFSGL